MAAHTVSLREDSVEEETNATLAMVEGKSMRGTCNLKVHVEPADSDGEHETDNLR